MKIKTSELTGNALDWAVAKCEYDELAALNIQYPKQAKFYPKYQPSLDWAQGGPIIERELIEWRKTEEGSINCWIDRNEEPGEPYGFGETLLIAAMRCYVNSKLGDVVDVPDELMNITIYKEGEDANA